MTDPRTPVELGFAEWSSQESSEIDDRDAMERAYENATREEQAVMDGGTPCPDCWTVHKGECL